VRMSVDLSFMTRELYVMESGGDEECVEHTPKWNVNG
jgi:hypothetical protein